MSYEVSELEEATKENQRLEAMYEARKEYDASKEERERKAYQEECPHDEHDHGICLECGKDIFDDVIAAAEFAADCREDR